jgi:hypothetical protein
MQNSLESLETWCKVCANLGLNQLQKTERIVFAVLVIIRALGYQTFSVPIRRVWGSLPIRPHLSVSLCLCVLSSADLLLLRQLITNKKQNLFSVRSAEFIYGFFWFYSCTPSNFDSWLLGIARESSAHVTRERKNKSVEDSGPYSKKKRERERDEIPVKLGLFEFAASRGKRTGANSHFFRWMSSNISFSSRSWTGFVFFHAIPAGVN